MQSEVSTEYEKKVLAANSDLLMTLNTKLGLYIDTRDIEAFQVLTRAINQIIEQRQWENLVEQHKDFNQP